MRLDGERHFRQFVGLLALTRTPTRSRRRLHFDLLRIPTRKRPRRPPTPPPMAQLVPNPRVKAAKFQGKSKEDEIDAQRYLEILSKYSLEKDLLMTERNIKNRKQIPANHPPLVMR